MAGAKAGHARRGDVCWVALDPVSGTEVGKTRPAIVVSNDAMNQFGQRVVVVPVTGNVDSCYAGEALVSVNGRPGRALGDQVRSIDKARLRGRVDRLAAEDLRRVDQALRITLALA